MSRILWTGGGGESASVHTGIADSTPGSRHPPPGADPPGSRHSLPGADPPCAVHAGRAGGTHPTGRHTCFMLFSEKIMSNNKFVSPSPYSGLGTPSRWEILDPSLIYIFFLEGAFSSLFTGHIWSLLHLFEVLGFHEAKVSCLISPL